MRAKFPAFAVVGIVLAAVLTVLSPAAQASSGQPRDRAGVAAADVQRYFDPTTGLFCPAGGNCWWWSANELTAVIDYSRKVRSPGAVDDIATTFAKARFLGPQTDTIGPFLDTWNDDDGWWGLAWVDAYDYARTYDPARAREYLSLAENIFGYIAGQWDTASCGGGLWQNQKPTHTKDAIANELFLSLGAALYRHTGNPDYRSWAVREWTWFESTGLLNSDHLVDDHLAPPASTNPPPCTPQGNQFWSYNQGVILGGLSDLYEITRHTDPTLAASALSSATGVANCVTDRHCGGNTSVANPPLLDARGILAEACGTSPCTYGPSYQFKGIFVRNLARLNVLTGRYTGFLAANADSVWTRDRNGDNLFGFYWDSPPPFYLPAGGEPAVQGSALDLLNSQLR
jgi:hypothetical protein